MTLDRRSSTRRAPITSSEVGSLGRCRSSDDEHFGAEFGERVGHREAGDPEAEHRDAQPRPVGVPADVEAVEIAHDYWLTHSR